MKALTRIASSLGCLALLGITSAHANLLVNGSFEDATPGFSQPTQDGTILATSPGPSTTPQTQVAGWRLAGLLGNVFWLPNANIYGPHAIDGANFLDLTGTTDGEPYNGVTQLVTDLVVGDTYRLSFYLGVDSANPAFAGPVAVKVSVNVPTERFATSNPDSTAWTLETEDFVASASFAAITIVGDSTAGGQYIGLDNVDLELLSSVTPPPISNAVPEPATLALFPLGFVGWTFARRRRSTTAGRASKGDLVSFGLAGA
jgi:hypothetical protein